jgi:FkbM family methyltransferase
MHLEPSTDLHHHESAIRVFHDSRYGVSFHEWLRCQLEGFSRPSVRSVALDVGAHEGEFFKAFLSDGTVAELIMFEPHPANAELLRQAYPSGRAIVEEMAVSSETGSVEFAYGEDTATGSLLRPAGCTPAATRSRHVPATSLDDYAKNRGILDRVNILKIDTQGADFQVLRGASELLRESQPILVLEMIFAPLYEQQSSPLELFSWLAAHGYQMAGIFDEHYSRQGWLAWCDTCFLPISRMSAYQEPFQIRASREGSGKRRSSGLLKRILGKA